MNYLTLALSHLGEVMSRSHYYLKLIAWLCKAFEGFLHSLARDGFHIADAWIHASLAERH